MSLRLDPYSLMVAFSLSLILIVTYFAALKQKLGKRKLHIFLLLSFLILGVLAKVLGALGATMTLGQWYWGPASIMSLYFLEIFYWQKWAPKQGRAGKALLRLWAYTVPWAQALGRLGCVFAGCCYIRPGLPLNWALAESSFLVLLGGGLFLLRHQFQPLHLFRFSIVGALIGRFILEFFRGDPLRGLWHSISLPQILCFLLLASLFLDLPGRRSHNMGDEI